MRKFILFAIASILGLVFVSACPTGTGPPTVQQTVCDSLTKHGSTGTLNDSAFYLKRLRVKGSDSVATFSGWQFIGPNFDSTATKKYVRSYVSGSSTTLQQAADSLFDTLFANHNAPNQAGMAGYIPGGGGSPFGVVYPVTGSDNVVLSTSPTIASPIATGTLSGVNAAFSGLVNLGGASGLAMSPLGIRTATNENLYFRDINQFAAGTGVGIDVLNNALSVTMDLGIRARTINILSGKNSTALGIDSAGVVKIPQLVTGCIKSASGTLTSGGCSTVADSIQGVTNHTMVYASGVKTVVDLDTVNGIKIPNLKIHIVGNHGYAYMDSLSVGQTTGGGAFIGNNGTAMFAEGEVTISSAGKVVSNDTIAAVKMRAAIFQGGRFVGDSANLGTLNMTNTARGAIHWRNNDSLYWDSAAFALKTNGNIFSTANLVAAGSVQSGNGLNVLANDGSATFANGSASIDAGGNAFVLGLHDFGSSTIDDILKVQGHIISSGPDTAYSYYASNTITADGLLTANGGITTGRADADTMIIADELRLLWPTTGVLTVNGGSGKVASVDTIGVGKAVFQSYVDGFGYSSIQNNADSLFGGNLFSTSGLIPNADGIAGFTSGGGGGPNLIRYPVSGSGNVALTTSPTFTTPNIGSATGSVSGNAGTATILQTSRNINGVAFNGSANINIPVGSTLANIADSLFDTLAVNHHYPNQNGIAGYAPGGGGSPFGVVYPVTGSNNVVLSSSPTIAAPTVTGTLAGAAATWSGRTSATGRAYFGLADQASPINTQDSIVFAGNGTSSLGWYTFGGNSILRMGRLGGTFSAPTATVNGNLGLDFNVVIDTGTGTGKVISIPIITTAMMGTASATNRGQAFLVSLTDSNSITQNNILRVANRRWNFNGATDIPGTQFHFKGNVTIDSALVVTGGCTGCGTGGTTIQNVADSLFNFANHSQANTDAVVTLIPGGGGAPFYSSRAVQDGSNTIATEQGSSFTATLTGVSGTVTGTFYYTITGQHVSITVPADLSGTSNATTMTFTGLPAALQPTRTQTVLGIVSTTATTDVPGEASFAPSSGTVTFSAMTSFGALFSSTGWAATVVTKAIPAQTFQYNLN